jgi:hypothetical protein
MLFGQLKQDAAQHIQSDGGDQHGFHFSRGVHTISFRGELVWLHCSNAQAASPAGCDELSISRSRDGFFKDKWRVRGVAL